MKKSFSPDTTIIIFDIHGVLCKISFCTMVSIFWHSPCKYTLFKYSLNPILIFNILKLWRKNAIANEYFTYIVRNYPYLAACIPLIIDMANAQVPNKDVAEIVRSLKKQGYALHILSNIDSTILAGLRATECGTIFSLFDVIHGTQATDEYGKPHKDFFERYIKECNPGSKAMIFIDNRKNNIAMAQKVGMTAIQFNNARQLKTELENVGINL